MKNLPFVLLIMVIGYFCHLLSPWWSIVVVAGLTGLFTKTSGFRAFAIGFIAVTLLWGIYTFFINFQNEGLLAERMGQLFGGLSAGTLVLLTAVLGGLLGGMGALTGNLGRKAFS